MCVAPMMSTRAGGTMACRKISPSGVISRSLSPLSKRLRSVASRPLIVAGKECRGGRPSSRVRTNRPRRPLRASSARSINGNPSRFLQALDEDLDLPTAR